MKRAIFTTECQSHGASGEGEEAEVTLVSRAHPYPAVLSLVGGCFVVRIWAEIPDLRHEKDD